MLDVPLYILTWSWCTYNLYRVMYNMYKNR